MAKWQPIDTAPKMIPIILAVPPIRQNDLSDWHIGEGFYLPTGFFWRIKDARLNITIKDINGKNPVAWQPLPEPPVTGEFKNG